MSPGGVTSLPSGLPPPRAAGVPAHDRLAPVVSTAALVTGDAGWALREGRDEQAGARAATPRAMIIAARPVTTVTVGKPRFAAATSTVRGRLKHRLGASITGVGAHIVVIEDDAGIGASLA